MLKNLYDRFSIIPLEGKAPILKNWTKYCKEKIDFEKIKNHKENFGVCCGFDGLEIIDIDNHFLDADSLYAFVSDNYDLSKFLVIKTGGGGYHIYFKSDFCGHNQIFAQRTFIENDETKHKITEKNRFGVLPDGRECVLKKIDEKWSSNVTIVESRGIGGQCVYYDNIVIENEPPFIDENERNYLLAICKALNEVDKNPEKKTKANNNDKERPGDMYINDPLSVNETISLLKNAGWKSTNDNKYWTRPGKEKGISATFGKVGLNKFYVFSSNAYPFESMQSHTMFKVRAILMHNNDFNECTKELSKKYEPVKTPEVKKDKIKNKKWKALAEIIEDWNLKFRFNELTNVFDVSIKNSQYGRVGLLLGDIMKEMETKKGIPTISTAKINEMVSNRSICKSYNPVKEFFSKIPKWDGNDTFKELCKFIELDKEENPVYFENMLKKHFCRAIKCAKIPEYINRIVFTFSGDQEIGKTRFWRWIMNFYPELYNEEPIDPNDKDCILSLARYIISNLDDLDSLNKRDVGHLKSFISRGSIKKRVAYGKHDESFSRITSFVASSNKDGILFDDNNTRWVIVKIKNFNWQEYTKKINPIQLWAQAIHELEINEDSGELTIEEKQLREKRNNDSFLETNSEREILMRHFKKGEKGMTATEIKQLIELKMHPTRILLSQLIKELYRLFGPPIHTKIENIQGKYYFLENDLIVSVGLDNFYESVGIEKKELELQGDLPF